MTPNGIKRAILAQGTSARKIAFALGINEALVSRVISGKSVSWRVRDTIGQVIGVPAEAIWPGPRRKAGRPRKTAA